MAWGSVTWVTGEIISLTKMTQLTDNDIAVRQEAATQIIYQCPMDWQQIVTTSSSDLQRAAATAQVSDTNGDASASYKVYLDNDDGTGTVYYTSSALGSNGSFTGHIADIDLDGASLTNGQIHYVNVRLISGSGGDGYGYQNFKMKFFKTEEMRYLTVGAYLTREHNSSTDITYCHLKRVLALTSSSQLNLTYDDLEL